MIFLDLINLINKFQLYVNTAYNWYLLLPDDKPEGFIWFQLYVNTAYNWYKFMHIPGNETYVSFSYM